MIANNGVKPWPHGAPERLRADSDGSAEPVMDGVEATREIRTLEGSGSRTPLSRCRHNVMPIR